MISHGYSIWSSSCKSIEQRCQPSLCVWVLRVQQLREHQSQQFTLPRAILVKAKIMTRCLRKDHAHLAAHPRRNIHKFDEVLEHEGYDPVGTPSLDGGLPGLLLSGLFGLSTLPSSTLVSLCKKLLSFTGLPLVAPGIEPLLVLLLLPLLPLLGPGEVK